MLRTENRVWSSSVSCEGRIAELARTHRLTVHVNSRRASDVMHKLTVLHRSELECSHGVDVDVFKLSVTKKCTRYMCIKRHNKSVIHHFRSEESRATGIPGRSFFS